MSYLRDPWIWLNFILGLSFMGSGAFLALWPRRLFRPDPPTVLGWVLRIGYVVGGFVYLYGGAALCIIYLRSRFGGNVDRYKVACASGVFLMLLLFFWRVVHLNSEARRGDLHSESLSG
jgi:hypothetical protein